MSEDKLPVKGTLRQEQASYVAMLLERGYSTSEVATALRTRFRVNARVAWRLLHGWSQRRAAEEWSARWPADPKLPKNFSYWERWPSATGHMPSLEVLARLAELYGCSVSKLLADFGDFSTSAPDELVHKRNSQKPDITASPSEAPDGWYVEHFTATLRLDIDPPEAVEERTIVVVQDGLTEITASLSAPRHTEAQGAEHALDSLLEFGGRIAARDRPHESVFTTVIEFSQAANFGDRREYRLRWRVPPGQLLAPHYVHVPLRRSDHFKLRVRFDPRRRPRHVWRVAGSPTSVIYDRRPSEDLVLPDRFGELSLQFDRLTQGMGYGICWEP